MVCAAWLDRTNCRAALWLFAGVTALCVGIALALPPLRLAGSYHRFADGRTLAGIPNCLNVVSNALFLLFGALGLATVWHGAGRAGAIFLDPEERWPYTVFFIGVGLSALGSGYYHLAPGDARLVWDRLPMTIAFMGFLAAAIAERVSVRAGTQLLGPLLLIGIGSVAHWRWTALHGAEDLRSYGLVQFYPMLTIPLLVLLFRSRYTRSGDLIAAVVIYAVAKLFELGDAWVFRLGHLVSGHTLKHVLAALSAYVIARMLRLRHASPASPAA